jgi:hypothetical protein
MAQSLMFMMMMIVSRLVTMQFSTYTRAQSLWFLVSVSSIVLNTCHTCRVCCNLLTRNTSHLPDSRTITDPCNQTFTVSSAPRHKTVHWLAQTIYIYLYIWYLMICVYGTDHKIVYGLYYHFTTDVICPMMHQWTFDLQFTDFFLPHYPCCHMANSVRFRHLTAAQVTIFYK